jgi:hypothetical protein
MNIFFNAYIEAEIERIKKERKKNSKDFISLIEEPSEEEIVNNEVLDYLDKNTIDIIAKQHSEVKQSHEEY